MKTLSILIILFLSMPMAFADWYVVNIDNQVMSKCKYKPDAKDLESRNEIAEYSEEDISLTEAEYRGNKIKKHVKTAKEIKADEDLKVEREKDKLINKRMHKIARDQLIEEGAIKE